MGVPSQIIVTGDLVRWCSPLYYIENGKEYEVSHWRYALVIRVRFDRGLELRVIGKHAPSLPIAVEMESLLSTGVVQVSEGRGKWRTLQRLNYI